jgi:peptide/nickel transport system permease protein
VAEERLRNFIIKRVLYAIPTLIGISIITFLIARLSPGDPVRLFTFGIRDFTQDDYLRLLHVYGLDKPIPLQYVDWITKALQGNFGESLIYHRESFGMVMERVPNTLMLAVAALLLQLVIGVPLGVLAAFKRGKWVDGAIRIFGVVGHAVPAFWLGLILIIVFAVQLRWLPSIGVLTVGHDQLDILDRIKHLILPSFVLALTGIANYSRILRTETLDVLAQDFVRTAHAKGLRERTVIFTHALRNALIPVVTALGGILAALVGGALVIEQVFSWPGVGQFTFQAAIAKDYPIVQAGVMFTSTILVISYLLRDLTYAIVDPRIKVG